MRLRVEQLKSIGSEYWLEEAQRAFNQGQPKRVLSLARQVLKAAPTSAAALHFEATAQADLRDYQAAEASYRKALQLHPDDLEILLSTAYFLIVHRADESERTREALVLCARARRLAKANRRRDLLYELTVLEAAGWNRMGESARAIRRAEEALDLFPDSVDALRELAVSLFDRCEFARAEAVLRMAAESDPGDGWTQYYLGLIEERRGDIGASERRFAMAHLLSPEDFPEPIRLSRRAFRAAVRKAVAALPTSVKPYLQQANILIEDIPALETLTSTNPPLSPGIVGVFQGTRPKASITLYQRNLERSGRTLEEVRKQITITVFHEIGHLLGLNHQELEHQGLH